ncbi:nucleotide disphospho-sugar-binding domain-containing protein [Nonomuraea sp. NPDC059007]|uniref:nucleotide disphospho-sugar-binding domain-containing protein n=1 Tax=Nonomuraea sp. NPDC059007 TaxID=3346692 RepID=UPI00369DBC21
MGHLRPLLPVAARLVDRGHEVWWHTSKERKDLVEASGARFTPFVHTPTLEELPPEPPGGERWLAAVNGQLRRFLVDRAMGQVRDYQAILDTCPADVLVVDACSLGALLMHELGGPVWANGTGHTPLSMVCPDDPPWGAGRPPATTTIGRLRDRSLNGFAKHLLLRPLTAAFNQVRSQLGLRPLPRGKTVLDLPISPYLQLARTTHAFEYPRRSLPPQIHLIGPLVPPPPKDFTPPLWWPELSATDRVVHVSQGTITTDTEQLVEPAIHALGGTDVLLVVTTPDPSLLGPLPDNVRVARWLPHEVLLPEVDVFVTNAGFGAVSTALAYGVPMVASGRTQDKPEVCARIAWAKVGIVLDTVPPDPAQLRSAVTSVLADPVYRTNAARVQADFARHDSPALAVGLLERLAITKSPVVRTRDA